MSEYLFAGVSALIFIVCAFVWLETPVGEHLPRTFGRIVLFALILFIASIVNIFN